MSVRLEERAPLKPFNTFGIEGTAAWMAVADGVDALRSLRQDPRVRDLPWLVLGGGSNILFVSDFAGLVVRMALPGVEEVRSDGGETLVRVGAGENWADLVERLLRSGKPGLENLAGIPGTAGAAPIQNIGAYGVELAERLRSVTVWDGAHDVLREVSAEECEFGYRDSIFKRNAIGTGGGAQCTQIIVAITLQLPHRWEAVTGYAELARELRARGAAQPGPLDVFEAVREIRRRKLPDPGRIGNAGSFFKNPIVSRPVHAELLMHFPSLVSYPLAGGRYKLAAGWLIEACGLKGMSRGRAGVFENQALVLVNRGGASGRDVWELAQEVQARVRQRFGVEIEPEPRIVGA